MSDAMAGGLVGGGSIFLSGLFIMWMASRMAAGRFKRNNWAGIRTPSTMKSDEAWNAAHETGAPFMQGAGVLGATGGLTGMLAGLLGASEGIVVGLILTGAAAMTVLLILATIRGARAARESE